MIRRVFCKFQAMSALGSKPTFAAVLRGSMGTKVGGAGLCCRLQDPLSSY